MMMFITKILWCIVNNCESHTVRCLLFLSQKGSNALGLAALYGKLAMVEFLLGRGFDLEAKSNVRLHFSYIACFILFNSSVTGVTRGYKGI
jgi:hypothetical protein